jgi:hypothetical protein
LIKIKAIYKEKSGEPVFLEKLPWGLLYASGPFTSPDGLFS